MDPNKTLMLLRKAIDNWNNATNLVEQGSVGECVTAYAVALDEWLSKGGSLPTDWDTEK